MKFFAALQFLTTIPLPRLLALKPEDANGSAAYFPAVGLLLGLILAGLDWVLILVLPQAMVNAMLIAALALLTGALHLDGFLDTCDGLAGHRPVEERWRIMHDSRAGGIGVIGAILLLLVEYISLNSIPASYMITTLIFMPVVSRWAMVFALVAYPYARPDGLGKAFKEQTRWSSFAIATLITIVAGMAIFRLHLNGLIIIVGVWLVTLVLAGYLKRKLAGLTGDTYGAINEVAGVSVLILVILLARIGLGN